MSQMKVSEIAARINKSTNDTLKLLIIEKVNVRSESSLVDNAVAEKLIEKFKSSNTGEDSSGTFVQKRIGKSIIRRRRDPVKPAPEPEPEKPAEKEAPVKAEPTPVKAVKTIPEKKETAPVPASETKTAASPKTPEKEPEKKVEPKKEEAPAPKPGDFPQRPQIRIIKPAPPSASQQNKNRNQGQQDPNKNQKGSHKPKRRNQFDAPKQARGEQPVGIDAKEALRQMQERMRASKRNRNYNNFSDTQADARNAKKQVVTEEMKAHKKVIRIEEVITVGDLSHKLGIKSGELILKAMQLGQSVTVNMPLDLETAQILSEEYGYEVENVAFNEDDFLESVRKNAKVGAVVETRSPVVTIMGHVDHGKTSLLDKIRETSVAAKEAGGITQHIGAYSVTTSKGEITFLDTPGHEAFTAMRARGAKLTDISILVVAADDGVKPQTIEAINHSKGANVPIIVAINKIDREGAQPDRVKQELSQHGLLVEDWGGEVISCEVSAITGQGIENLLEMISLQAEMMELNADVAGNAVGVVLEAKLEKGRGPVANVLITEGTLKTGSHIVSDQFSGKVRLMTNDKGETIQNAGPSTPVELIGMNGVPPAGEKFFQVDNEKEAKRVTKFRAQKSRERELYKTQKITLDNLYDKIQEGDLTEFNIVLKTDVQGSIEALRDALEKLQLENIRCRVIHSAVGGISESDVMLAIASEAAIIGFNVRPDNKAKILADNEGVNIEIFNVIYDAVDSVKEALIGLRKPVIKENMIGRVEIRQIFKVGKIGNIAGSYVLEGKIIRDSKIKLIRDNIQIYEGTLGSLRQFKNDVKEVTVGKECGLTISGYDDIKELDVVEVFEEVEVKNTEFEVLSSDETV